MKKGTKRQEGSVIPPGRIESSILMIRGEKVMLDLEQWKSQIAISNSGQK
jgi:hypothetical protein